MNVELKNHSRISMAVRGALAATALAMAGGAYASPLITGFEVLPGSGGTLDSFSIDNDDNTVTLGKSFVSGEPLTLRMTVAHGTGSGGPFTLTETITNNTNVDWTDYHISIDDVSVPGAVNFNQLQNVTFSGGTLDPDSDQKSLNFTAGVVQTGIAQAVMSLVLRDPGQGNVYTVDISQVPTVNGGPIAAVPIPLAGYLLGSALLGMIPLRRRKANDKSGVQS